MKKAIISVAALLALTACSVKDAVQVPDSPFPTGREITLTAYCGTPDATSKTVRQPDGKVFWSPGDMIYVDNCASSHNVLVDTNSLWELAQLSTYIMSPGFQKTLPSGWRTVLEAASGVPQYAVRVISRPRGKALSGACTASLTLQAVRARRAAERIIVFFILLPS